MRYSRGTYGKDSVESNSLVANLLKYPEIARGMIRQYPQYSLNYFVDGTGRFAKEELIGENAFRWSIIGRLNRPSTCTGTFAGNGANFTSFTVEFEKNTSTLMTLYVLLMEQTLLLLASLFQLPVGILLLSVFKLMMLQLM